MKFRKKKIDDMRADELFRTGREEFDKNEYQKAILFFSSLIERHPEHVDGRLLLADCYMKLKQYDEVCNQCEYILEGTPDHALAHYSYGLALVRDEKYEEGMGKLKRAMELAPEIEAIKNAYLMLKYTVRQLDIKGLGAKYTTRRNGMVIIQPTKLLKEIAEKCLDEDKVVPLGQLCIESNEMPEQLPIHLNMLTENTGIRWSILKIGPSDTILFEKP
ncbi:MAG: tetratricopeptide repeat protein [Candidatus Thorarchaeota archaeon]|jgi:tetratricopeptide (TPR) repeat protein